jgi:hypothetical protein
LLAKLSGLKELPYVGDVRGKGRQIGMELVKDQESKQPASAEKVAVAISDCQEWGLIIGKNGDIAVLPASPLSRRGRSSTVLDPYSRRLLQARPWIKGDGPPRSVPCGASAETISGKRVAYVRRSAHRAEQKPRKTRLFVVRSAGLEPATF